MELYLHCTSTYCGVERAENAILGFRGSAEKSKSTFVFCKSGKCHFLMNWLMYANYRAAGILFNIDTDHTR